MADRFPSHLRIHQESTSAQNDVEVADPAWVKRLCKQFQEATGHPLAFLPDEQSALLTDPLWSAPVNPGVGTSPGYLVIGRYDGSSNRGRQRSDQAATQALAATIAELLSAYRSSERSLWQREAELAAGVPVTPRKDEKTHLAARLSAVLKAGAEAAGCQAAGLYLLDAATTELKLRSSWNLPTTRLLDPPRPLRGAVADLEAMSGSAVVLEDDLLHSYWKVPEDYPAAVCLPLSTPSTILGTVWFFADEERTFTDQQTNQLEIIAGRLAADLEREMLLAEGESSTELRREVTRAEHLQAGQDLIVEPDVDGWEIAAWQQQGEALGGAFQDAWMRSEDRAVMTVGTALDGGLSAAIVGASVKSALRAHGDWADHPLDLLTRTNRTLWTGSAGDQFASVLASEVYANSGLVRLAAAGQFRILIVDQEGNCHWRQYDSLPLALSESARFSADEWRLLPGSTLVAWTGFTSDIVPAGSTLLEAAVCEEMVAAHREQSVKRLAELLHDLTNEQDLATRRIDHALLVLRRSL